MEPKNFYVEFEGGKEDKGICVQAHDCSVTESHVVFYGEKNRVVAIYRAKDVKSVIDLAVNAQLVPLEVE